MGLQECFIGSVKKNAAPLRQEHYIAISQGQWLSFPAKFEGEAGGFSPGAGWLLEEGENTGEVLNDFDLLFCVRGLQKFGHHQVRTANSPLVHQGIYLPEGARLLAEVVLPDGRINECGQRRMACFRGHRLGIAPIRRSSMARKAFEGFYLFPFDKFMDCYDDRLGFVLRQRNLHEVFSPIPGQGDRRPFHETLRHKNYNKSYNFNTHMSSEKICVNESHGKMIPRFPEIFPLEKGAIFG